MNGEDLVKVIETINGATMNSEDLVKVIETINGATMNGEAYHLQKRSIYENWTCVYIIP